MRKLKRCLLSLVLTSLLVNISFASTDLASTTTSTSAVSSATSTSAVATVPSTEENSISETQAFSDIIREHKTFSLIKLKNLAAIYTLVTSQTIHADITDYEIPNAEKKYEDLATKEINYAYIDSNGKVIGLLSKAYDKYTVGKKWRHPFNSATIVYKYTWDVSLKGQNINSLNGYRKVDAPSIIAGINMINNADDDRRACLEALDDIKWQTYRDITVSFSDRHFVVTGRLPMNSRQTYKVKIFLPESSSSERKIIKSYVINDYTALQPLFAPSSL